MNILDLSSDDLLEILKRVRVADIRSWIETCKAFASLRDHLALPLQLLRLVVEHDLSPDILELPAGVSAVKLIANRPQRFENILLQEGLNDQSLVCYHTTIQNEQILQAKIVPGGRWLVTTTLSVEDPSEHPMMCRVWDLDLAKEGNDLEPYASMSLPNAHGHNSGVLWLRRSTEGNTAQIWVCTRDLTVIEFDHLDRERPLKLLRIIGIEGMDSPSGIGLHGDYVFSVDVWTISVLNWVTGSRQEFGFNNSTYLESSCHVLSVGPEGLVTFDQDNRAITYCTMPNSRLGARDESKTTSDCTGSASYLRCIKQTPIQGIVPYDWDSHWPLVNRPYSARQPATAVIRLPQHLIYVEHPSNPRETDLDRLPLAFDLPPGSSEPVAFRRTMDGNVVGVGVRGFDVHFLMKDGRQSVQSFEHGFGDNFTPKFVCPFAGVIGSFGTSHQVDKIYLWKVDWSS